MNAHARISDRIKQQSRPIDAVLDDVIAAYDNDDPICRKIAEDALRAGRPAYWTTCGYHSQLCIALARDINQAATALTSLSARIAALEAALEEVIKRDQLHGPIAGSMGKHVWYDGGCASIARAALSRRATTGGGDERS